MRMERSLWSAVCLSLIGGIAQSAPERQGAAPALQAVQGSGVTQEFIDPGVRAQDDFFHYLSGKWIASTEIPADKPWLDGFIKVSDVIQPKLRAIVEQAAKDPNKVAGSDTQKIGDFYASFMDEAKIEQLGIRPLQPMRDRIAAVGDKRELPALFAQLGRIDVKVPYSIDIHQDAKDSTRYVADMVQNGLGLPDRDYYLKADDAKLSDTLVKYGQHVERILTLAGDPNAAANAKAIVAFETALARIQWDGVANRDPGKIYNKVEIAKLGALAPGHDWRQFLDSAGVSSKVDYVIVSQPSYLRALGKLLDQTALDTLKAYLQWQLLAAYDNLLPKAFAEERFAFYGTTLQGVAQITPRWQRGIGRVEDALGEALGKLYVEQHFPAEHKGRIKVMVQNLLTAFGQSIDKLDWMTPKTRKEARIKLAKITQKIGYPDTWLDYSTLAVVPDDVVGNVMRSNTFNANRAIAKLGKPVDRAEWGMTPQTVNAYYDPELNEIVFPAALLQPPFFDPAAEDAVNYGAIGAVIGHEISHAFDDAGAQYDGDGNLRNWWSKADQKNFAAKGKVLVKQYGSYSPIPGYKVNGELTLGENIADVAGTAIAFKAYKLSLNGKPAPVIDGLTGEQRFYMGWAQVWRTKMRDATQIMLLKSDVHSPGKFRTNGTLQHQPGFYEAFKVKPGDKMYLPPKDRVTIW